jgi:hypothetical protein
VNLVAHTAQANHALGDHPPTGLLHRCGRPRRLAASRSMCGWMMLRPVRAGTDCATSWTCPRHITMFSLGRIAQTIIAWSDKAGVELLRCCAASGLQSDVLVCAYPPSHAKHDASITVMHHGSHHVLDSFIHISLLAYSDPTVR